MAGSFHISLMGLLLKRYEHSDTIRPSLRDEAFLPGYQGYHKTVPTGQLDTSTLSAGKHFLRECSNRPIGTFIMGNWVCPRYCMYPLFARSLKSSHRDVHTVSVAAPHTLRSSSRRDGLMVTRGTIPRLILLKHTDSPYLHSPKSKV